MTSMFHKRFLPNPDQFLLLQFCLLTDRAVAIQAWEKWKKRVDLDDLDYSSFRIISLVYRRLIELGINDPDLGRIKGIYRYQWTRNQLAERGKAELLRTFQTNGIATLLLKGAALSRTVYPEPTTRGMHDLDFLVPFSSATQAMQLLIERNWVPQHFDAVPMTIEYFHACSFLHPEFGEVDLHWHVMRSHCQEERDVELWAAARDFSYQGTPTKILYPADQLLHTCEHGQHHSPASALQWLVDAVFILRHSPSPFDWSRLLDQSRKFQVTLVMRNTLAYLHRHFEPSIPREILTEFSQQSVAFPERIEYFLAGRPASKQEGFLHRFGLALCHYLKLKQGQPLREASRAFPLYLRLFIHGKREWSAIFREEFFSTRNKWRDDLAELFFRIGRLFNFQSLPIGGLITRFEEKDLHGFYPVEKEFGSPFRWTRAEASMCLSMSSVPHLIRIQMRPLRDLARLFADDLTFQINGHEIPRDYLQPQNRFFDIYVKADWLKPNGEQTLGWSIQRWPAPTDPRHLGLPISRLWVMREKSSHL